MNKLEILLENHNDDIMVLVNTLYNEKYPKKKVKKKKTICHFKVLGNDYNDDIFVKNYIKFMSHVTVIKNYDKVKSVMKKYISKNVEEFSKKCRDKNQAVKLNSECFIKTYSPTKVKIKHIKKICEELLKCEVDITYKN